MLAARWSAGLVPPMALAFWRWVLALLVLLPFTGRALWRARHLLLADCHRLLALGGLGMGICGAPFYIGATTSTAANLALIFAGTPVLIILLDRLGGGGLVGRHQRVGIALCFLGMVVVATRGDLQNLLRLDFVAGDLWVLLSAVGWSCYSVLLRRWPSPLPVIVRFSAILVGGVIVMMPFYALELALRPAPPFDLMTVGTMVFLALVPGVGACGTYGKLVAMLGPSRAGAISYLTPLYAILLAWLVLGEPVRPFHLIGGALILPGIYLATVGDRSIRLRPAASRRGS